MSELRPYQVTAIDSALAALSNSGSAVLQMPTGAGKTKTAMEVVAGHEGVVWVLCHRKEIIRQTVKAFRAAGIDFGVISPAKDPETGKKYEFQPEKRVQIASVGSIGRRIGKLPVPSLVIWDECHHTPAASWRAIRDRTQAAKHVGLTATPERQDGTGLRELFDEMIVGPSIKELVDDGFLSPFRYFAPSEPDLSAARMQAGDYRKGDIEKVMNTPILIGDAVSEYKKSIPGKRALVFAVSVDASRALVEKFREEGIAAAHVDANTPDDERDAAVADLASGKIKVLSNVEVFTEGFDIPAIDAVFLMRPTRSVRLYLQMIGRVLRVAEGKDCAMIFDHAGLYNEPGLGLPNGDWHWSLDGGAAKERRKALERGPRKCPKCNELRTERVEVCACGFEFPTGREIGEFDGVLREIRGEVPEGCETIAEFARRWGLSSTTARNWLSLGLPSINGYPLLRDGDEWVKAKPEMLRRSRGHKPPDGFLSQARFAARHGVAHGKVSYLVRTAGLPSNEFGSIPIHTGDKWMRENKDKWRHERPARAPHGFMSQEKFAKRHGYAKAPKTWPEMGLPIVDGYVPVGDGDQWVRENINSDSRSARVSQSRNPPAGFMNQKNYAESRGINPSSVTHWVRKGYLPTLSGLIPVDSADAFLRDNYDRSLGRLRQAANGAFLPGYDSKLAFTRRIDRSIELVRRLIRSGLPHDHELGIPILPALEWVRDNRPDIKIPPEAWPSANDNPPPAAEAA